MNVHEAHRVRHLVIRLDQGDELPAALVRALDEAEARSGFITGMGALEVADLAPYDSTRAGSAKARRVGPCEVVSLSGNVALLDGAASVRLSVALARETELGLATFGGQLVWGRVSSLELHVVAFDDLALTRVADERTGQPVLAARTAPTLAMGEAPKAPARPGPTVDLGPVAIPLPPPATPPAAPTPAPSPAAPANEGSSMPQRPQKPQDDLEVYPEVGDVVMHFAFGECTVIGSDGDRIRLRQDRDGRVREVALTMLRIEPPSVADGTRHFKLHRKN
jgi:predicted DNA-binding protein with PD1-like motif